MQICTNKKALDLKNPQTSPLPNRLQHQLLAQQHTTQFYEKEQQYIARFSHRLQILRVSADAQSSFLHIFSRNQFLCDGDTSTLHAIDIQAVTQYLTQSSSALHVFDESSNNLGIADDQKLFAMLILDKHKQIVAVAGGLLASNKRTSAQKKKLIRLVMKEFTFDFDEQIQAKTLQSIHSQHVQLSALNQDLICIKDSAHKIVYANPSMLATFPASAQPKIFGFTTTSFYDPSTSAKIICSDISAFSTGYFKGNELLRLANGEEKIFLTTKKAFTGTDGRKYLMSVSRDITDKEILINDLKRSNADLDNFAYVASHDLRAPLNAIKRLVSYVVEDCKDVLPNDSKEDLSIVLGRTKRMEKLLFDLLSYARIDKDYQEAIDINLRDFVIELLSLVDLPMGFVFNCDNVDIRVPEVPFNVVMLNLVANAIKHHDSGNAKIEIKAKQNEQGCVITVQDNGPGIEKKNRERIFKLFETLKPRDEVEGSGMGLSVVKKLVEHYGGNIRVTDNKPRGSKFIVTWPLHNMARSVLDGL